MFSSSLSLAKTHFTMKYNSRNQSLQSADVFLALIYPVGIYLLKVNNENTRAICNVSSQSTLSSFHTLLRSSRPEVYCKKVFLEHTSGGCFRLFSCVFIADLEWVNAGWVVTFAGQYFSLSHYRIDNPYCIRVPIYNIRNSCLFRRKKSAVHDMDFILNPFFFFSNWIVNRNCHLILVHTGSERKTRKSSSTQPAITCSKLTIETLEKGVK